MDRGGSIEGLLKDFRQPVAGTKLTLLCPSAVLETRSDAEGRFRFEAVPTEGPIELRVQSKTHVLKLEPRTRPWTRDNFHERGRIGVPLDPLEPGEERRGLEVSAHARASIRGRVVEEETGTLDRRSKGQRRR